MLSYTTDAHWTPCKLNVYSEYEGKMVKRSGHACGVFGIYAAGRQWFIVNIHDGQRVATVLGRDKAQRYAQTLARVYDPDTAKPLAHIDEIRWLAESLAWSDHIVEARDAYNAHMDKMDSMSQSVQDALITTLSVVKPRLK